MSDVSSTVKRSIQQAVADAPGLIGTCVDHAITELQDQEHKAAAQQQRNELGGAWRELVIQRKAWISRFPLLLRTACETAASGEEAVASTSVRPSSLSLVDDNEVLRNIETARLGELLNSKLDKALRELDGLMSTALGLDGVQPERNPLRPQVYAQTVSKLVGGGTGDPGWPGLWLRNMTKPLAEGLEQLYRAQSQALTSARVEAAEYRVLNTPSGARQPGASNSNFAPMGSNFAPMGSASRPGALGPATGFGEPTPQRGASAFAELSQQDLGGTLFQDFLTRGSAQANWGLAASYYAEVDAELAALEASAETAAYDARAAQRHMHVPAVDRPVREVGTASPLPQEQWGAFAGSRERSLVRSRLKKEAKNVGQVLGLEVVRKLVDQVARDPRLLAPVREAIVALEPSLLRLAMVAPRFFTDDQHPGRRLVERVAERSFKHNDEFSVDFQAFFHPVRDAFAALNAMEDIEDAKPFEQALAQLEAGWAAQDVLDEEAHQQSMSAVRFAETRQAEADRIAWELSQRSDLVGVNSVVQDFLFGTWSLVMANARLANARKEIDPGGFVALVADLLWSVNQESTLRDPARAFEVIPRVLVGVRKGLDTVGNPPEASMAFMLELERLHRPVMKLRAKLRGPAGRAMLPEAPPAAAAAPVTAPQKGQLWLTPREQRAAGFEEAHSDHAPLAEENADAESLLAGLAEGSWVDMLSKDQWRRCRLAWASGNRAFYMFVSHGGQPHSMTRRTLHRMLRERHVRPVDGDAVVPRAMQQIKREAAQAQPARASVAAALA